MAEMKASPLSNPSVTTSGTSVSDSHRRGRAGWTSIIASAPLGNKYLACCPFLPTSTGWSGRACRVAAVCGSPGRYQGMIMTPPA